jgi:hypothetical protein
MGTGVNGYVIYCNILYRCDLHMQGLVERVFFYHFVCSFVTLCGSSSMHWGLPFTFPVINLCFCIFLMWLGWLSERINAVVGCSGSLTSALCHNFSFLCVELQPSTGLCVEVGLQIPDWIV